jgi:ribose transport system permease protein
MDGSNTAIGSDSGTLVANRGRWSSALAPRKIGAIYVLILIIIIFSFWAPSTFPKWATVQQVLNVNSVTALVTLGLVVPLSAGVFDLSIGYTISISGMLAANWVAHGVPLAIAVGAALLVSCGIGVVNGIVVVGFGLDSFIATLATGSLIQAGITAISHDNSITSIRLAGSFSDIAQKQLAGFTLPVFYSIVVATVIWYLLEHTATGRRIYAIGFNSEAARLAGLHPGRVQFWSLVVSSGGAGTAGIVLASQLTAGSPVAGNLYLLPAFAAAFLGATQLKEGRFNAWGTIIAVVLLGVGTTGLGLANAPIWSESLFTGVVLVSALTVTQLQRRASSTRGGIGGPTPLIPWLRWPFKQAEATVAQSTTDNVAGE